EAAPAPAIAAAPIAAAAEDAPAPTVAEAPAVAEDDAPAAAAPAAPAPPEAPPPPPPTTARLRVRTVPPTAALTVDGRRVANPYEAELPLGARVRIEAEAEGHRDASRTLRLTGLEEITLTLAPRPERPAPVARAQ